MYRELREWIALLTFLGWSDFISKVECPPPRLVFLYPLANYTGTAEVVHGGTPGYNGLGDVNSFDKHPMLDYNSTYFDGNNSSFVELRVGTSENINGDWSFTMFVYSVAPHTGTVFDFIYDGGTQTNDKWSNTIRLELNETHMLFTLLGDEDKDYGSAVIDKPAVLTHETWIPLSVVHDKSNGKIKIQTINDILYASSTDNENGVKLPLPARLKLGGAYNQYSPFEGSITCFAIYKSKFSKNYFNTTLQECKSSTRGTESTDIGITLRRLQKAYACSTATTGQGRCIIFDISCGGNRIRIRKALYGFREEQPEKCLSTSDKCKIEDEGCCTKSDGDELMPFSERHYHDIHKACSWQERCFQQTPVGADRSKTASKYSVIYYECQSADHEVYLCGNDSVTGKSVNIIFNGSMTERDYSAQCVCQLQTTNSSDGYRVSAPDMRLQSVSGDCNTNASIAGLKEKRNITCSKSLAKMGFVDRDSNSNILLSFTSKPQFIWILAQAKGESKISVNCFPPTDITYARSQYELNSEIFPVTAVVIPVILMLLGIVVGLVVWQRWHRRYNQTNKHIKGHSKESQNQPSSSAQNKAYDNTDQLNGPRETADNYIVLGQENAYTYIDHEDAKTGLGSSNDSNQLALNAAQLQGTNYSSFRQRKESSFSTIPAENEYTGTYDTANTSHSYSVLDSQASTKAVDKKSLANIKHETNHLENHNYFVLEPQNTHTVEDESNRKRAEQSQDHDELGSHNYFVLELEKSMDTNPKSPQIKETSHVDTTEKETTQNHSYFVLESQNSQIAISKLPKTNATTTSDLTLAEKAKYHNVFALEPQDTYSSIDPEDVLVQTLPENEYNLINMKGKPVNRDPNYGTLITANQIGKDIEENNEYSHIQTNSDNKLDMNEYSHTDFTNMKPYPASATDDWYSQLNPTNTKPSGVPKDGNEYSHVRPGPYE